MTVDDPAPLGRYLFLNESPSRSLPYLVGIPGLILAGLGFLGILVNGGPTFPGLALVGLALLGLGFHLRSRRVDVHANGVVARTLFDRRDRRDRRGRRGSRTLLFSEVSGVQQWGGKVWLLPSDGGRPLRLFQDSQTEELRDYVAMHAAARLYSQMEEQGSVAWTPDVQLSRWGIRSRSASGDEELVPLSSSLRITVDPYHARVHHPYRQLVPTVATGEAGFHPGLILLQRLIAEASPDARTEPEPEPAPPGLGLPVGEIRRRWVQPTLTFLIGATLTASALLPWMSGDRATPDGLVIWLLLVLHSLPALRQDRIAIHERGVAVASLWDSLRGRGLEVPFAGLRGLRFAQRVTWFGVQSLFEMLDEDGKVVVARVLAPARDLAPGNLRDRIAGEIADALAARLDEGDQEDAENEAAWTADVQLTRTTVRSTGDAGDAGRPQEIPISKGLVFTSDGNRIRLYQPGSPAPDLVLDSSEWGAYPGLLLLQRLMEEAE